MEARLRGLLEPYAARLETGTIYGIPTLRRRGAKAHDWFAFVKPAAKHVSLFLLPIHTHPELLRGLSPALRKAVNGKSTLAFTSLDDDAAADVKGLLARAFEIYTAG